MYISYYTFEFQGLKGFHGEHKAWLMLLSWS